MKFGNNLGNGLGAEMQAYLDKTLLTNISETSIFDRLATGSKQLPLKNSKEIRFDKWVRMADLYLSDNLNQNFTGNVIDPENNIDEETLQYVPKDEYQNFVLEEGSSGQSKSEMKIIKQTATVFPIGDWMPFTEEMEMFHNRWTAAETAKQMGELAGYIIDGFYRDLYVNGAGHLRDITGGGTGNDNVVDAAFTDASRKMKTALYLSGARPVNSIMSASPLYGTVPVKARYTMYVHPIVAEQLRNNPDFTPIEEYKPSGGMEDEVGIIGELRVVENANAPLTQVGTGEYECECIVVGQDHTYHIPVRGKNSVEFILKPIGSNGADPLNRVGTTGWKTWLGAKTLYPERLGIIKAKVSY
jgi:N4-gp56 family major capsid protein